ncbi:hypothetical protein RNJ44_04422 [Nakaseomyces bracarensis]|uniref:5'-3' DNA helicase ZGRF1-like N-terminal domain-containing protein n=1 Tax=Nakaseomyces bracarensis TaxID=273131 RepID=A0ABR4NV11_9SACH
MEQPVVREYSCQYTDQIKKKHKTWQDGKLKYQSENNKFILYSDPEAAMLSSGYITNIKELDLVLDPAGFGSSEHKIFSRYVVIIEDIITEYRNNDGHPNKRRNYSKPDQRKPAVIPKISIRSTVNDKKPAETMSGLSGSQLALKFNKQFTKPRAFNPSKESLKKKVNVTIDKSTRVNKELTPDKALNYPLKNIEPNINQNIKLLKMLANDGVEKTDSLRKPRKMLRKHKIEHKPINIL